MKPKGPTCPFFVLFACFPYYRRAAGGSQMRRPQKRHRPHPDRRGGMWMCETRPALGSRGVRRLHKGGPRSPAGMARHTQQSLPFQNPCVDAPFSASSLSLFFPSRPVSPYPLSKHVWGPRRHTGVIRVLGWLPACYSDSLARTKSTNKCSFDHQRRRRRGPAPTRKVKAGPATLPFPLLEYKRKPIQVQCNQFPLK